LAIFVNKIAKEIVNTEILLAKLQTNKQSGLPTEIAAQRLKQQGANMLVPPHTIWQIWLKRQYQDKYLGLLVLALLVGFYAFFEGSKDKDLWLNLLFVLPLSLFLDWYYTQKAFQWVQKKQQQAQETYEVLRGGKVAKIFGYELVVGDMITVKHGQNIPADLVILEANNFAINQAFWTGASKTVEANAEKNETILGGCKVVRGEAKCVVVATGNRTEAGKKMLEVHKIANSAGILQSNINLIAKHLLVVASTITLFFLVNFNIGVFSFFDFDFLEILALFNILIFKGLYLQIKVSLAIASHRLEKNQMMVQSFAIAETLGSVDFLVLDKTGTLTEGEMKIDGYKFGHQPFRNLENGKDFVFSQAGQESLSEEDFILSGYYSSEVKVYDLPKEQSEENEYHFGNAFRHINEMADKQMQPALVEKRIVGDPYDSAFCRLLLDHQIDLDTLPYERLLFFPFDNQRVISSAILKSNSSTDEKTGLVVIKGSSSKLIGLCQYYLENDVKLAMTEAKRLELHKNINAERQNTGASIVSIAYKEIPLRKVYAKEVVEDGQGLIYAGFVRIYDPLQSDIREVLNEAVKCNIKVCVLTGDTKESAKTVLQNADLQPYFEKIAIKDKQESQILLNIAEFWAKNEDEKHIFLLQPLSLLAGCADADKKEIVRYLQTHKHIVAMVGDGMNDTLGIKQADVGVATTRHYNEVVWKAADLLAINKQFAGITTAITEGKLIFHNFSKLLATNLPLGMVAFVIFLLGNIKLNIPENSWNLVWVLYKFCVESVDVIAPHHYIFILVFVKTLPIILLSYDNFNDGKIQFVNGKPALINLKMLVSTMLTGLLISCLVVLVFLWTWYVEGETNEPAGSTFFTYFTIVLVQMVNILASRSAKTMFAAYTFSNKLLLWSFAPMFISVIYLLFSEYNFLVFGSQISFSAWISPFLAALVFLIYTELRKKYFAVLNPF
jgi:magnesium-transporting ATPase (P-type)